MLLLGLWLIASTWPSAVAASVLGSGELQIAGSRLTVSPESQTVPFDIPTIIETHLESYDPAAGVLPTDLRVVAELAGPEIDGVLVLETVPNEPFRIPRLRLEGEYRLSDIRLVQGDAFLAYAEPRSAAITVTQVLITSITSRALTLDEIRHFGLVIDEDSFQALNLTFGFGVEAGRVIEYNMPLIYRHYGPDGPWASPLTSVPLPHFPTGTSPPSRRFTPPQLIPFEIELVREGKPEVPTGGCDPKRSKACRDLHPPGPPLVGVILFPSDISLLHQYFSVVLMVQNGAPEGDPLVLRDVVARISLPQGLRQAETEPPTPLGVPVPVRVPGPDGELGTADDLNFIIARVAANAEFLVEGLREGTHTVQFDLEGILEGLPGGRIERITGRALGAVVVRDPTLSVTISHPSVVRANQAYSLGLTVTNNGTAPVNLLSLELPTSGLSGVTVLGPQQQTVPELLPGDAATVEFELLSHRNGRVVASSVRTGSSILPVFEWAVSVGENIPLSPETLSLPAAAGLLPDATRRAAMGLIGLGHSSATAPRSLLPVGGLRMGREAVNERIYRLGQAGRHVGLGEELFDALAVLSSEFAGARDFDWEWDRLRRETLKGGQLAAAFGAALAAEASDPRTVVERYAQTTSFLHQQLVMAEGGGANGGVELEVMSRTSGKRTAGTVVDPEDPARVRDLPFAEIYPLNGGELAVLTQPEEGGYRASLRHPDGGAADLQLIVPNADGELRNVRWSNVSLTADTVAFVDFSATETSFVLKLDEFGDGLIDGEIQGSVSTLQPRPFEVVAAVQSVFSDPSGHVVEVLFSSDVDLQSLLPRDPNRFTIPGKVSNGGLIEMEMDAGGGILGAPVVENPLAGLQNNRILKVVFDNPLSPYVAHDLTLRDIDPVRGNSVVSQTLPVQTTVTAPGGQVEGQVIGPDGRPVPFAEVALFEIDKRGTPPNDLCLEHRTAKVVADADGRFLFDYVRQTACGDVFRIEARDIVDLKWGEAQGRIRRVGEVHEVDVVMIGRGTVRGRVTYEDGTVPQDVRVVAYNPVFNEGRLASVDEEGNYLAHDVMVGTVTLAAHDSEGRVVYQTLEIPQAGSVVDRDLTILRSAATPQPTGEVRGTVLELDGATPVADAYVALYVDGQLIATENSAVDGGFDFGRVPAGVAQLEAFDGETGRYGAQHFFEIAGDQVAVVELLLRDDRGTVEGYVYRQLLNGSVVPIEGAVVYAQGTPFNTLSDASGFYRLEDVFAGTWGINAADLVANQSTRAEVTITSEGGVFDRDLYFFEELPTGGITGEVLDYDGNPVAGARVHLSGGYHAVSWFRQVNTNELGRFALPDLDPGTYGVHAISGCCDGGLAFAHVRFPGDTPFVTVRFRKGTITGQTLRRKADGSEVGVQSTLVYRTTHVEPAWDIVVLGKDFDTVRTADNGTFRLDDVLVGPYELHVYNQFHGTQSIHNSLEVHGQENDHRIVFEDNGTIRGVVTDVDGVTPVPGVTVNLTGELFNAFDVVTDQEGRFTFDLVPPGSYTITAHWESGVIFRQQRIGVHLVEYGGELEVEIPLPAQGAVIGWVQDADGLPVPGAVVTLNERGFPWRQITHNADDQGNFQFNNIFEGEFTVHAQAPTLGGIGGKKTATVDFDGQEVFTVITLEPVGEVTGTVIHPETGEPVVGARAALHRSGFFDSITTDDEGRFRFRLLPLGFYEVRVFDPATGRRGRSDWVEVAANHQVVPVDVVLESRGVVEGHFYDSPGDTPIPGATIELWSRGLAWFRTYSSTDAIGSFEFGGIPEGLFELRATDSARRRRAVEQGTIQSEDERVTVDLRLAPFGTVRGQVVAPPGAPPGLFERVNVLIQQGSAILGASSDNPFEFSGVLASQGFQIFANELGGLHRATLSGRLPEPGATLEVEVPMEAIGRVTVSVVDSFGSPVVGADVSMFSYARFGLATFSGSTGGDHQIQFEDVGQGEVLVQASDPLTGLEGSTPGQLDLDGQNVEISVTLQASGSVRGRVVAPDGTTPAAGATVALDAGFNRFYLAQTDANGAFEFNALALGSYILTVQESYGLGALLLRGSLDANGEVDDLGTLVLDDEDPYVVSITPPSGARDLPLATQLVVTFSEPLDRASLAGGWVQVKQLGSGFGVPVSFAWSNGDRTVAITPQALASGTGYELRVTTQAVDLAGRHMDWLVRSTFNTADVIPPAVIDLLPRDGDVQVPVDGLIKMTFSEPIVEASLSGAGLELRDLTDGRQLTTTFQLRSNERQVVLTPQDPVYPDRQMQVRVQGAQDLSGNVMVGEVVATYWTPDATPPTLSWLEPAANAAFSAGDAIAASVTVADNRGVDRVVYSVGDWDFVSFEAPYSATLLAPVVASETDVVITATAFDIYGNSAAVDHTVRVQPHLNASAPVVEPRCWGDGDFVAPGYEIPIGFSITDDERIESYALVVDGVRHEWVTPVNAATASGTFLWRPPVGSPPGTVFELRLEARDFAGIVGAFSAQLTVPSDGPLILGDQIFYPPLYSGQRIYLAAGTFLISQPSPLTHVTVLHGATVRGQNLPALELEVEQALTVQCGGRVEAASLTAQSVRTDDGGVLAATEVAATQVTSQGVVESAHLVTPEVAIIGRGAIIADAAGELAMEVSGTLTIEPNARLDATGTGYAGSEHSEDPGGAPTWMNPSIYRAGGSHGGVGAVWFYWDGSQGPAGEIYGSPYVPGLRGGGGSGFSPNSRGGYGGGALNLEVETLVLEGRIASRGENPDADGQGAGGAGGSVLIRAGSLSGGGQIDASGGDVEMAECPHFNNHVTAGAGGGGRVAVWVDSATTFDPGLQAQAQGGAFSCAGVAQGYAAAGTVYLSTPASTRGSLIIDNGTAADGSDRAGLTTRLPTLGNGPIVAFDANGADGWLTADRVLRPRWHGAWAVLEDATGSVVSAHRVLDVDASGRLLLEGNAGASATSFRGEYRFDTIDLGHGAQLQSDEVNADVAMTLSGTVRVVGGLDVADLTLRDGTLLQPEGDGHLNLQVAQTLTVEAGAVIDVSRLGYADRPDSNHPAPPWVSASVDSAGGSHGGIGTAWPFHPSNDGPSGEIFDSVYRPTLGGGGGDEGGQRGGSEGGGVIVIEAGQLVLDGELLAGGGAINHDPALGHFDPGGAGGTVSITTDQLQGSGTIDVSGGLYYDESCPHTTSAATAGAGGGGRVAIRAGDLGDFEVVSQVTALGGSYGCIDYRVGYAAPGTIFTHTAASTYGSLLIDAGLDADGADRAGPLTELPALGGGVVSAVEIVEDNLWVVGAEVFRPRWLGAWVRLDDGSGTELGSYEVMEIDGTGRLLLGGAGPVAASVTSYHGRYRFDDLQLLHGAGVSAVDPVQSSTVVFTGDSPVSAVIQANNVVVADGAVVRPVGGGTLRFEVANTMTVEAGGTVDVSRLGYADRPEDHHAAPWWVTASTGRAGGSHGGVGSFWPYHPCCVGPAGEVFGSVARPHLGGGGGEWHQQIGGEGGGVIDINASVLVLDGELVARGGSVFNTDPTRGHSDAGGAGGSVAIDVGELQGSGRIDASGGSYYDDECPHFFHSTTAGAGGGGRVAIRAQALSGFDPASQVDVSGGSHGCVSFIAGYAAAGTLWSATAASTYGDLRIDNSTESDGGERAGPATELPRLGSGSVVALEVAGADQWLTGESPFRARWLGAWVTLSDPQGIELGSYLVIELDAEGGALLKGAAGVGQVGDGYHGVYRFDTLTTGDGASVQAADPLLIGPEVPAIYLQDVTLGEADGTAQVTVSLSFGSDQEISVDTATVDGSAVAGFDFTSAAGTLTIPAGTTSATVAIDLLDDAVTEGEETFTLELSNPVSARIVHARARITVLDNDAPAPASDPTLIAYWPFDDHSDPSIELHGTAPGARLGAAEGVDANDPDYQCQAGELAPTVGNVCGLRLVGDSDPAIGDYLEIAPDPALDVTTAFTLAAWVRIDSGGNTFRPIFVRGATGGNDIEVYREPGSLDLMVVFNRGNGGSIDAIGFTDPPEDELFHLAVTFEGVDVRVYYNGVEQAIAQRDPVMVPPPLATGQGWWLGRIDHPDLDLGGGSNHFLNGVLDEVRFYDRALDGSEVTQLAAVASLGDGLVGHWPADDVLDPSADVSGQSVDAELGSSAGSDANDPGFVCSASGRAPIAGNVCGWDFTGDVDSASGDYASLPNHPALDFTSAFSISSWVIFDGGGLDIHRPLFTRGAYDGVSNSNDIEVYTHTQNRSLIVVFNRGNGGPIGAAWFPAPPQDQFFHLAVTYNGAEVEVFYDGVRQTAHTGSPFMAPPLASGHVWLIGTFDHSAQDPWGYGRVSFFDGVLDDVRFYDRPLIAPEIHALARRIEVALPTLSVGDVSVTENEAEATFTVTLSEASGEVVSVDLQTVDDTAVAGSDYIATVGTLSLAVGEVSASFAVPLLDDGSSEAEERFQLVLTAPVGAALGDAQGDAVIADDDGLPEISVGHGVGFEAAVGLDLEVQLSQLSSQPVTLDFATVDGTARAGVDYVAAAGTLPVAAGEATATLTLTLLDDSLAQGDRSFAVALSNPGGGVMASDRALVRILDDEGPADASLVGYWTFDDVTDPAVDISGSANPARLGSTVGPDANNPTHRCAAGVAAPVAGNLCGLELTGANDALADDQVFVASDPALEFTSAFTLSAWVRINSSATDIFRPIFVRGAKDANDIEVYREPGSHDLMVVFNRTNGGVIDAIGFEDPPLDTLFHLAVTFEGSTVRVFYDGLEQAIAQRDPVMSPAPLATGRDWWLGRIDHLHLDLGAGGAHFLDGFLDEVRFHNRALTVAEIRTLAKTEVPLDGLVGRWSFDDQSDPTSDGTSNGNAARLGTVIGVDTSDPVHVCTAENIAPVAGNLCGLEFTGENDPAVGDEVWIAHDPALDMTSAFTIAAWIRLDSGGPDIFRPIFVRGTTDANDIEIYREPGSHDLMVVFNRSNGGVIDAIGFADPPLDVLFHLAVTFEGSTVRVFYDGAEQAIAQRDPVMPAPLATGRDWWLGRIDHTHLDLGNGGVHYLDGFLDEVTFYERALVPAEIRALASADIPDDALAGYWPLDDTADPSADVSGFSVALQLGTAVGVPYKNVSSPPATLNDEMFLP